MKTRGNISRLRTRSFLPLAASVLFLCPPAVRADEVRLSIGPRWTVVRETRIVDLKEGEQEWVLEDLPAEADLSSLLIRSPRVPVELTDWERVEARDAPPNPGADASLSVSGDGSVAAWRPAAGRGAPSAAGPTPALRCRIRSPAARQQFPLEVIYRVRGIRWTALYQVAVRGEQAEEKEPVAVDLHGMARIENGTSRSFARAQVRLVGERGTGQAAAPDEPGFLMVDEESPLADLWKAVSGPKRKETEYEYEVPSPVDLPARSRVEASLVRTVRTPADRHYAMVAEDFPPGWGDKDGPLRKVIVFRNVRANQMGRALPPGPVRVYLAGLRTHQLQEGWFDRTPANGEVRVDLGLADDVRGKRITGLKSDVVAGFVEQDFSMTVRNARGSAIVVDVDEKPPVVLQWDLLRSSKPCEEAEQRLHFSFDLGAGEEETVEYRLRVRQPSL